MPKISEFIAKVRAALDELEQATGGDMPEEQEVESEDLPTEEPEVDSEMDEEAMMSGMRPKKKPGLTEYFASKGMKK